VVQLAPAVLWRGPSLPAVGRVEDEGILPSFQGRFRGLVLFQRVEVFEEKEPGCLLRVVEFRRAAALFPERVVDILECLFEHGVPK